MTQSDWYWGPFTEDLLKNLYFNKSFLGANGIDETLGVTTPTIEEATKKRMVKRHSDQIYLVCDSSKFHKLSNVKAFDLDDVIVISDKNDTKLNEKVDDNPITVTEITKSESLTVYSFLK